MKSLHGVVNVKRVLSKCIGRNNEKIMSGPRKGQNVTDDSGYYSGYCQCSCKKCMEGKRHCQGTICKGD
jgi:hypothetical protein